MTNQSLTNGAAEASEQDDSMLTASAIPDEWSVSATLSKLPNETYQTGSSSPLPFFHLLQRLKNTKREGWRRFGIGHGESIADHMYRMSIITMLAPPDLASRLNIPKCTKMALVHDMAESIVGDITPVDKVAKAEKSRREEATMQYIAGDLLGNVSGGIVGEQLREIWNEYEAGETLESKFVHDVDKVELLLQMVEYERANHGKIDLSEFSWVAERIQSPEVRNWSKQILEERNRLWSSLGIQPRETRK